MEPVEDIAGLEIGQAEARHDVRAADDEDAQVDEEEEELGTRRERANEDDQGDDGELDSTQHRGQLRLGEPATAPPACYAAPPGPLSSSSRTISVASTSRTVAAVLTDQCGAQVPAPRSP